MAAGIAHDFNNLLTAIAGLAEVGNVTPSERRRDELFTQISGAAFQAADLTNQLLLYLGRPTDPATATDLTTLVESSQGLLASVARPKSSVEFVYQEGSLPAHVGTVQARQILVNLVSNAADAVQEAGVIIVTVGRRNLDAADLGSMQAGEYTQPGEFCFLQVQDQGAGIPESCRSERRSAGNKPSRLTRSCLSPDFCHNAGQGFRFNSRSTVGRCGE